MSLNPRSFIENNWKWLLTIIVGGVTLYNTVNTTAADVKVLKDDMVDVKKFIAVQGEINNNLKEFLRDMKK